MPVWMIVDTKISDPEAYEAYKAQARPIIERFGGVYRARGGALSVEEDGLWTPTRLVIIEFPDMASARACLDSADYAPVRAIRRGAAACTMALVEGL
jgi:uncharacterized protein (DUF1330 family)